MDGPAFFCMVQTETVQQSVELFSMVRMPKVAELVQHYII